MHTLFNANVWDPYERILFWVKHVIIGQFYEGIIGKWHFDEFLKEL